MHAGIVREPPPLFVHAVDEALPSNLFASGLPQVRFACVVTVALVPRRLRKTAELVRLTKGASVQQGDLVLGVEAAILRRGEPATGDMSSQTAASKNE
jgi:hypothetical protein